MHKHTAEIGGGVDLELNEFGNNSVSDIGYVENLCFED
jgi:hypothetical protein